MKSKSKKKHGKPKAKGSHILFKAYAKLNIINFGYHTHTHTHTHKGITITLFKVTLSQ
jgi:hypothetical protein